MGYNLKCYPNPVILDNGSSRSSSIYIEFNTLEDARIKIDLYNVKGQKIKTLYDCFSTKGKQNIIWDSKNEAGKTISTGQYFIKMRTGNDVVAKKIIVVK